MHIQQNKQLKFTINRYYPLDIINQYPIILVSSFFRDGFNHIHLFGTLGFINKLKNHERSGMSSEMISLDMDNNNNLAYISETTENSTQEVTPEIHQLIEDDAIIELCHRNFVHYAVMTQTNLFHLLLAWEEFVNERVPFILIYQDDQDWYDSLGFETQETMEKFVADHTKPE